jgi:hypothetical protein
VSPARPSRLFIVGAPRCGTTALFDLLSQHPDVCGSVPKEPHCFCTDFHEESDRHHGRRLRFLIRTPEEYRAIFRDPSKRVQLEASTAYLQSRSAPANIRAFDPEAHIVVMVREPVMLLQSLHAKMTSLGVEDLRDFQSALDAEDERRAGRRLPPGLYWPSSLYYSDRIKLGDQIERYRSVFSAARVKVIVYDDFRDDNLATYAEVARFAGLDERFRPDPRRVNPNREMRFPALSRLLTRVGDSPVRRLFPAGSWKHMGRRLRYANTKITDRRPLDPGVRRALMARVRPEVERLSQVLDRDLLTLWGYK